MLRPIRLLPLALALALAAPALHAQDAPALDPVGRWEGALQLPTGVSLRVVFEVARSDAGELSSTMYSPDQTDQAIPTGSTTWSDGTLDIRVPVVQGGYVGTAQEDGTIVGDWTQGGGSLPLTLTKVDPGAGG